MQLHMSRCAHYRSPSQTKDEFEDFIKNVELILEHNVNNSPFLIVILAGFNARSQSWYKNIILTAEGSKIDISFYHFGLIQVLKEATHNLKSYATCVDSIFNSQIILVMHSGVDPSLHPNYHHQVVSLKFNLKIYYPPPYEN